MFENLGYTVNNDLPKIEDLVSISTKVMFLGDLEVNIYQHLVKAYKTFYVWIDLEFCLCFGNFVPNILLNILNNW